MNEHWIAEAPTSDPMTIATAAVVHVQNRICARLRLEAAGHGHGTHAMTYDIKFQVPQAC